MPRALSAAFGERAAVDEPASTAVMTLRLMSNPLPEDISMTARALGMVAGYRAWIGGHCLGAKRVIVAALRNTNRPLDGPIDAGFLAPLTVDECSYFAAKIRPRLVRGGAIWVVYAQSDSSRQGEFQGSLQELENVFSGLGFCNCTQIGLEKNYLSARFRPDNAISHDTPL